MRGLEKDVQVHSCFVTIVLLKHSGNDSSGKAGLAGDKGKGLGGKDAGIGLLRSRSIDDGRLAAANREHMRGHGYADRGGETVETVTADREPPSGIEQVAGIVADVSQFQARHWAVVAGLELPFVLESQGSGGVLRQARGKRNAHRGILG